VEGKNRQIRRMAEASGRKVKNLHRVAIGELIIGDLPPGGFRLLNPRELKLLLPGQTTGSQHDTYREPHR
jgi:16S rRNA U516 pseudouridylate synthase RsuA-like enzyme